MPFVHVSRVFPFIFNFSYIHNHWNGEWFEIFWISIKVTCQEALGFYMFHYFNISIHIIISALFSMISVLCFLFFAGFLKINGPGWGISTIFLPQGAGFLTFFVPMGWGIRPFKKIPQGFAWGRVGSGLELTDTLNKSNLDRPIRIPPSWWVEWNRCLNRLWSSPVFLPVTV